MPLHMGEPDAHPGVLGPITNGPIFVKTVYNTHCLADAGQSSQHRRQQSAQE